MPRLTGFPRSTIPGPWALPGVGVLINVLRILVDPVGRLPALRAAHGDLVSVAAGSPAFLCAFGPELNRQVLGDASRFDNEHGFLLGARPGSPMATFAHGMPFIAGETHRRHRRLVMPAFHRSALQAYARDIVDIAARDLARWPLGQVVDVDGLTRALVQRIVLRCLFGLDPEQDDGGLAAAVADTIELVTDPRILVPLPIPGTPYARLVKRSAVMVARLRALVAHKRALPSAQQDALSLMVHAVDEDGAVLTEDELLGEVNALYVAGHDTQAKTLAWTMWLLEQHPAVLGDLLDELDAVLGGRDPTPEDLPRMVLLDRVIKESMRLIPTVPMSFPRVASQDTTLAGYDVPAGANVIVSAWITHRDEALYPQPLHFQPERWERIKPSPYEYLPFGAGHRMCIGAGFATLSLRLLLPMILQRFRFSLRPGAVVSQRVRGNILGPRRGIPMRLRPPDRDLARCTDLRGDMRTLVALPGG